MLGNNEAKKIYSQIPKLITMDKTIKQQNKAIQKFMGQPTMYKIVDSDPGRGDVILNPCVHPDQIEAEISHFNERYGISATSIPFTPRYDKNWADLMPVVDKIGGLYQLFELLIDEGEYNCQVQCFDDNSTWTEEINGEFNPEGNFISLVYDTVCKYVNWHNENYNT